MPYQLVLVYNFNHSLCRYCLRICKKVDSHIYEDGFDAYKEEYTDMISSGIVDPTKVTRSALQNAASIASTLLTTESAVCDIPTPPAPPAPGGDMGGMY